MLIIPSLQRLVTVFAKIVNLPLNAFAVLAGRFMNRQREPRVTLSLLCHLPALLVYRYPLAAVSVVLSVVFGRKPQKSNRGVRTRTLTDRVRICSATITPRPCVEFFSPQKYPGFSDFLQSQNGKSRRLCRLKPSRVHVFLLSGPVIA